MKSKALIVIVLISTLATIAARAEVFCHVYIEAEPGSGIYNKPVYQEVIQESEQPLLRYVLKDGSVLKMEDIKTGDMDKVQDGDLAVSITRTKTSRQLMLAKVSRSDKQFSFVEMALSFMNLTQAENSGNLPELILLAHKSALSCTNINRIQEGHLTSSAGKLSFNNSDL